MCHLYPGALQLITLTTSCRSKYFHTNLQHCSDVGRLAFLDAQKRMNKINSVARSMMDDGGNISYIVQLLEDPDDAKHNLKPELEEVKNTASKCRKECEDMKEKFEYWQSLIIYLSNATLDLHSKTLALVYSASKTVRNINARMQMRRSFLRKLSVKNRLP